jgi:hypothetical protein
VRQKFGIEVGSLIFEEALPGTRSSGFDLNIFVALEKSEDTIMIFIMLK